MDAPVGRFKIVTVGWRCEDWWQRTLESVEAQSVDNWDIWIMYDGGDDAGAAIQQWCDKRDDRWNVTVNDAQHFAVRNQVEAIERLDPGDNDVVVFLDLDGDQLAHRDVLAHLAEYYADGTLLTYGSFKPVPAVAECGQATPFPAAVIRAGSYREHMLTGSCCFNHLRTIKGRIVNAIPSDQFKWDRGPLRGQWYEGGTDYVFMVAALELAGGRHKFVPEVLLLYNHANPNADNLSHPAQADACVQSFLRRPPLAAVEPGWDVHRVTELETPTWDDGSFVPTEAAEYQRNVLGEHGDPYLQPEARRQILREYGARFALRVFIETGTNDGGTPWALKDDFDELYTIELGARPWREAVERFAGHPQVTCLRGDSAEVLPQVLGKIDRPALIWLDGHWSGGDTARGSKDTPVVDELEAIFATGIPHVVLVDDARLFAGMPYHAEQPNWPHLDEVRQAAALHAYTFELADDIIRLTP